MNKEQLIAYICNNDKEAYEFVCLWIQHAHNVDDQIDGEIKTTKDVVKSFVNASALFNHPYFVKHYNRFYSIYIMSAADYVTSVEFLKTTDKNLHAIADVLRSTGNKML